MWAGPGDLFLTKICFKSDGMLLMRFDYLKKKKNVASFLFTLSHSLRALVQGKLAAMCSVTLQKGLQGKVFISMAYIKENLRLVNSHVNETGSLFSEPFQKTC